MSTGLDVDVEAETLLGLELGEDLACELYGHGDGLGLHDEGPGVWYGMSSCPKCSKPKKGAKMVLMCEQGKDFVLKLSTPAICEWCMTHGQTKDFVQILGRR